MDVTNPTIDWWMLLLPWHRTRLAEQLGGELARECRAELWQHIGRQIVGMSVPEARGYARVQAARLAADRMDLVLGRRSLDLALRSRMLASGIDQLIGMAVRDALSEQPLAESRTRAA
jgi:hypothetical protein